MFDFLNSIYHLLMDLSVIIVNYNSAQLVINCLQSIFKDSPTIDLEIIVVDNNSTGDGKDNIQKQFPRVRWIRMNYNSGFARANNEGIRQSSAPVILLLNGDTLPADNSIGKCYSQFIRSAYVACGVQLINPDGTPQISGNYFMKGGLNYLLPLPYLGSFFRWIAISTNVKKPNVPEAKTEMEVDWINGAFLMVKKKAIQIAGLLDEDFFLYAEEGEWCSRLGKTGKLCIYGNINVMHLQGETANETFGSSGKGYKNIFDRKGLQIMLSNLVRIRKQFGVGWFLFILSMYVIEVPVFFIGYILSKIFFRKSYPFKNVQQYTANIFRLLKFTFKIIRNKPFFYKVL